MNAQRASCAGAAGKLCWNWRDSMKIDTAPDSVIDSVTLSSHLFSPGEVRYRTDVITVTLSVRPARCDIAVAICRSSVATCLPPFAATPPTPSIPNPPNTSQKPRPYAASVQTHSAC